MFLITAQTALFNKEVLGAMTETTHSNHSGFGLEMISNC